MIAVIFALAGRYPRLRLDAMEDVTPSREQEQRSRATAPACNIVLIGFMACGKTMLGKRCARATRMKFIDTDQEIENEAGMSISAIFETVGEAGFRRRESEVLRRLGRSSGCVVATGGGIVTVPENLPLLKNLGFVVWLHALPKAILERAGRNSKRPLLQTENPEKTIADLLETRMPLYEKAADLQIETGGLDPEEVVAGIVDSARYFFSGFRRAPTNETAGS